MMTLPYLFKLTLRLRNVGTSKSSPLYSVGSLVRPVSIPDPFPNQLPTAFLLFATSW